MTHQSILFFDQSFRSAKNIFALGLTILRSSTLAAAIVALRLRHHSFAAIGRTVGISKQAAQRAFQKALHRNTDKTIQTHHRSELAELESFAGGGDVPSESGHLLRSIPLSLMDKLTADYPYNIWPVRASELSLRRARSELSANIHAVFCSPANAFDRPPGWK